MLHSGADHWADAKEPMARCKKGDGVISHVLGKDHLRDRECTVAGKQVESMLRVMQVGRVPYIIGRPSAE